MRSEFDPELAALVDRFGSPIYVYDLERVRAAHAALVQIIPDGARLLYSLKANPATDLAACVADCGAGAEVSSAGELASALAAGFAPSDILYTGPGPTAQEVECALELGVTHFSVESPTSMRLLAALSIRRGIESQALIRINLRAGRSSVSMAGSDAQFGCVPAALSEVVKAAGPVRIAGMHSYLGSQAKDQSALVEATEIGLEAAQLLSAEVGELEIVNLGGGFAAPYATSGNLPSYEGLQAELMRLVDAAGPLLGMPRIWYESGRYLAATAGTLVTRVADVRDQGGRRYLILESGINHLGGMSGLGRLPRVHLEMDSGVGEHASADVVGPLCTPLDVLGRAVDVADVVPGALVAIPNVGAYGLTASLVGFLSRDLPIEVFVDGGHVTNAIQRSLRSERVEL